MPNADLAVITAPERVEAVEATGLLDSPASPALDRLTRSLVANMVQGVHEGFSKKLEVYGTGYGCDVQGRKLNLNVGFMGRGALVKPFEDQRLRLYSESVFRRRFPDLPARATLPE